MKYSRIVWDFNGTIVNDVVTGINSVNILLRRRGLRTVDSIDYYYEIFGFPIIHYYERLGFDFSKEPYVDIANEWFEQYKYQCRFAPMCRGVLEAINGFNALGVPQIVLSMSETRIMKEQLAGYGILDKFEDILGLDDIYAYSKLDLARSLRERCQGEKMLMLGDTSHDFETAKILGADCVLISGGHESENELKKCGVPVVGNAAEILTIID